MVFSVESHRTTCEAADGTRSPTRPASVRHGEYPIPHESGYRCCRAAIPKHRVLSDTPDSPQRHGRCKLSRGCPHQEYHLRRVRRNRVRRFAHRQTLSKPLLFTITRSYGNSGKSVADHKKPTIKQKNAEAPIAGGLVLMLCIDSTTGSPKVAETSNTYTPLFVIAPVNSAIPRTAGTSFGYFTKPT